MRGGKTGKGLGKGLPRAWPLVANQTLSLSISIFLSFRLTPTTVKDLSGHKLSVTNLVRLPQASEHVGTRHACSCRIGGNNITRVRFSFFFSHYFFFLSTSVSLQRLKRVSIHFTHLSLPEACFLFSRPIASKGGVARINLMWQESEAFTACPKMPRCRTFIKEKSSMDVDLTVCHSDNCNYALTSCKSVALRDL